MPRNHTARAFCSGGLRPFGPQKTLRETEGRWLIAIREFARVQIPDAWDQGRNPVRYRSLAEFRVNPDQVTFHPMPQDEEPPPRRVGRPTPVLTLAEAKRQLAETFGVKPDAVEITIRA